MREKDIFKAISLIDDDIIKEAEIPQQKLKVNKMRKSLLIAAVIVVLFCVTVWAANIILVSRSSHLSNTPTYNTVPSESILKQDIGFSVNIKKSYSTGYTFKSGHITENEDISDQNETLNYKGIFCIYENKNKKIYVSVEPSFAGIQIRDNENHIIYKGIELFYYSYKNKIVPPDYKMTEQDIEDEKTGKYVFSFGSNNIEIKEMQGIAWEHNKINFEITDDAAVVSKQEIIQIAKETIDYQGAK